MLKWSLTLEALERRRLLSGITIITHGWNSDSHSWVSEMGNAIARAIAAPSGDPTTVAQYTLNASGSPITVSTPVRDAGPADWGSSGEAIIKLDWASLSGGFFSGTPTGSVADAFADYLFTHTIDGHSVFEQPVHLIGHSRGASLNTELARKLAEKGIWVDDFTALDPHPVDGMNEDIGTMNFGDTPMSLWSNVQFADNYWHTDSDSFDFNGESIPGAANVSFSGSILKSNATGYSYAHLYTHLWYHGTIGPETSPFATYSNTDGSATITNPSAYYSGSAAQPLRTASGFYYSATENGVRPAAGVGIPFGGSGPRAPTPPVGTQWPDVAELSLRYNPSGTLSSGEQLFVSYRYQDADSAATVAFYADADTNPYNANATALPDAQSVGSTGASVLRGLYHGATASLSAGAWHVYARISDPAGHVRYAYLPQTLTMTTAAAAATLSAGQTLSGAIAGGSIDVYSFAARTGDTFTLTMGNLGSAVDPQLELYGPTGALLTSASGASSAAINALVAATSGMYYIVARDQGNDDSGAYNLSLSLTPAMLSTALTGAGENVYLRRSASDSGAVDAWINSASPGQGNPTMSVGIATLGAINLLGGDDQLTLDCSNTGGLPLTASATIDGGGGLNDQLIILGTAAQETFTFASNSVTVAGTSFSVTNVEWFSLDGKGGNDNLSVAAGNVALLSGQRLASIASAAPGTIDLAQNWIITDSPTGTWTGSAYAGVTGLVATGRLTSSAVSTPLHAVGVASASALLNIAPTSSGTWNGRSVLGSQTLAMYTYAGDATLDGQINIDDYTRIDSGIAAGLTGWLNGDFNYDGKINIDDYTIIDGNLPNQGPMLGNSSGMNFVETPALVWGDMAKNDDVYEKLLIE
jgi:hypothetical protein